MFTVEPSNTRDKDHSLISRLSRGSGLWVTLATAAYIAQAIVLTTGLLWKYVDPDQMVEAEMARRYSEGFVPEPYFWGQPYMFPIDSWLAVPLIALGIRADLATMIVTVVAWYFPFILVQVFLARRPVIIRAALLVIPLVVPIPLTLVSLIPRNFGAAAGVAATCVMLILFVRSSGVRATAGLFFGVAVAAMPPVGILAALIVWFPRQVRQVVLPIILAVVGFAGISLLRIFYVLHPSYIVFPAPDVNPSFRTFLDALAIDEHLFDGLGVVIPVIIIWGIVAFSLRASGQSMSRSTTVRASVSVGAAALLILCLLAVPAINNHTDSLFFSFWRYWTALPGFAVIFATAWVRSKSQLPSPKGPDWQVSLRTTALTLSGIVLIATVAVSFDSLWLRSHETALVSARGPVPASLRSQLEADCRIMAQEVSHQKAFIQLDRIDNLRAYGCYALYGVNVVNLASERRTWLLDSLVSSGYRPVRP